jgi:hypothetical protein
MTRRIRWMGLVGLGAALALGAFSCMGQDDTETTTQVGALIGDAIPGTNATTFAAARANFMATESNADGFGPIYNEHACDGYSCTIPTSLPWRTGPVAWMPGWGRRARRGRST